MAPANLNQTEQLAWSWLIDEQGYDPGAIDRRGADQTPDFFCPDEAYDVKRLYPGEKIVVSDRQLRLLDKHDPIILVMREDDDEPLDQFRWSARGETDFTIQEGWGGNDGRSERLVIRTNPRTKGRWHQWAARYDDDDEALQALLDIVAENENLVQSYW